MELRRYFRIGTILFLATAAQALTAIFGVSALLLPKTATAVASVPYLVNFQGRLTDNSGNALSDGSYNVKFRLMSAPTSGTNLWEGDRVMGASDNRISIVNGLFNIQFGDTTKGDPALSPALFNTQTNPTVYLEVELPTPATAACATNGCAVFTEGAMTPRQPLASAPYAFNSDTLDGLDSAAFGQLSAIQSWTDTNTFSKSGGAAIVLSGTAASGGSILQIGSALSSGSASGTLFGANTTAAGDLINLQVSSALRLKVDNAGALTTASTITSGAGIGASGDLTFTQGAGRNISIAQATSGAGNSLTLTAGQSGTGANNGGDLVLKAGATGGSGTSGSVKILVNGADTTTAFQVQNAASAPAFTIDTVANKIVVGDATGTNTATSLLVVDTATADPATGYNGAMYYNSTSATFRCYQAGAWTSCITPSITATSNSHANFTSGVQNVAASQTGLATGLLNWTSNVAVANTTAVAGGFTAPAAGSFRSCLVENNAAITAGTLSLRWRVNGVSVGSAACNMTSTINRQAATALDNGVVTFPAGATISVALDTNAAFLPTGTNDFTIFWGVEYNSSTGNGLTLQFVYDSSNSPAAITLANAKDLVVTAADTATDPNFLVNLQCVTSCSTNGRFAVQNAGTDAFAVAPNGGGITLGQSTTVSAGKNLSLASGTGTFSQTYTNTVASSAHSIAIANTNTGAGVAIQGIDLTPTNTSTASSGTNTLNLINFAAGGALGGSDVTNGLNFASTTGYTNFLKTPNTTLAANGDLTTAFTALNGTSIANGAGTASTTLILTSATNFDVGNYVQVNSANCGGTGVNPCYAKITAIAGSTLTITPALTWANGSTVNEYHLPEIGGTDTAQTLANRYGRGYFISGVAAGNGTTYYNEDSIDTSLAAFSLLNDATLTSLTIGNAATTVTMAGNLNVTGNITAPGTGTSGYWSRSGTTLQPATAGDDITTSGTVDAGAFKVGGVAGASATCSGGQMLQNPTLVNGLLTGGTCAIPSGTGAATNLSNVSNIATNLIADANNTRDLGSAGVVWSDLFVSNVDAGTTTNALTIGTAATTTALTLGRSGLAVSLPGGLTTSGGAVATGGGNLTTGGGTIDTGSGSITTTGAIGGGAITGTSLSSSGGSITAGAGAISGAVLNATTKFQLNGTDGTASACGAGAALTGATFTGGILTAAGACTTFQAAGSYIVQAPAGTANTITAASGAQALILKGTNGTATHLLDIYNTAAVPVLTSYFDQNGALTTTAAITAPTSGSTINGLIVNSGALSGITTISTSSTINGQTIGNASSFVTSVSAPTINASTTLQVGGANINTGGGTPTLSNVDYLDAAQSLSATKTFTKSGGQGAIFSGSAASAGVQLQFGSVASLSGGSTSGTYIGANPASYAGDFLNFQINNVARLKVDNAGNLAAAGNVDAGSGKLFTIGGTQISSANLSNDSNITKQGNTFNGTSQLVQTNGSGALPALSGTNLTNLNPTNLVQGSGAVTLQSAAATALTITANAASTWSTTGANQLTLQSGSGTISLGSTTILTASGALAVTAGSTAQNISLNPSTTGSVVIGGTAPTVTSAGAISVTAGGTAQNINLTPTTTGKVVIGGTAPTVTTNGAVALVVDAGGAATLGLGSANASAITLGRSGITTTTNGSIAATATAPPTTDQIAISNVGQPVATAGVNGLNITYVGGAGAIESSAEHMDVTPGTTSGSTWNGLRLVAGGESGTGGAFNGLKLEGPATTTGGTDTAVNITTGWDIGVNVQSGGLQLNAMSDPAAPTSGNLRVYVHTVSGRTMLKALSSTGIDYTYQPSLFQQNVFLVSPGSTSTTLGLNAMGAPITMGAGTYTNTLAGSESAGYMANWATTTITGTAVGFMQSTSQYYRGSVANGDNGFFVFTRMEFPDTITGYQGVTGTRFWSGLTSAAAVGTMTASDAPTGDFAGFRISGNAGETTFRFLTRNNATTTNTNTLVTMAQNKEYDLYFYVKPFSATDATQNQTIYWRIDNLTDGVAPVEGSVAATLPTAGTAMRYIFAMQNLNATSRNLKFQRAYVETDR